eukprot:TRINITY_DN144_c1_g1_i2.p1 TRINITY_DN144_c1_g1~~TRINITY_DN144_c1_g1_i2.p1  ORF type:complete len:763 (-),score=165.46 TRINITY_DN144_c1_g1_i2:80-2368(-)
MQQQNLPPALGSNAPAQMNQQQQQNFLAFQQLMAARLLQQQQQQQTPQNNDNSNNLLANTQQQQNPQMNAQQQAQLQAFQQQILARLQQQQLQNQQPSSHQRPGDVEEGAGGHGHSHGQAQGQGQIHAHSQGQGQGQGQGHGHSHAPGQSCSHGHGQGSGFEKPRDPFENYIFQQEMLKNQRNMVSLALNPNRDVQTVSLAVIHAGAEEVRVALERNVSFDHNQVDAQGFAPIHYAARKGDPEILELLLKQELDANQQAATSFGETPLFLAVDGGSLEGVHQLLRFGADQRRSNKHGDYPIHYAVKTQKLLVALLLLQSDPSVVNLPDGAGRTPIHWAAYIGNHVIIKHLIKFGADVTKEDDKRMTALHWAATRGFAKGCLVILEKWPSGSRAITASGDSAVDCARKSEQWEVVEVLEEQEASLELGVEWMKRVAPRDYAKKFAVGALVAVGVLALEQVLSFGNAAIVFLVLAAWLFTKYATYVLGRNSDPFFMGVYLWSIYFAGLIFFWDLFWTTSVQQELGLNFALFAGVGGLLYCYYHLAASDPGYVSEPVIDIMNTLAATRNKLPTQYCPSCLTRKLVRTKHCRLCNKCVPRFDHHCKFSGNCVSYFNLGKFLMTLTLSIFSIGIFLYFLNQRLNALAGLGDEELNMWERAWKYGQAEGFGTLVGGWLLLNGFMLGLFLVQHLIQIGLNFTTNEMWNRNKYEYLKEPGTGVLVNPFFSGVGVHVKDFILSRFSSAYVPPLASFQPSTEDLSPLSIKAT